MMPRLEASRGSASTLCAVVAFVPALGLVYLFHQHRGPIAIVMSLVFGLLAARVAFFTIERITRYPWKQKTPVLGQPLAYHWGGSLPNGLDLCHHLRNAWHLLRKSLFPQTR